MKQGSNIKDTTRSDKKELVKSFASELCGEDSDYVPYHAYFFTFFAAMGAFLPYLALYFKQLGLSAAQAGILFGVRPLSEVLIPVWGWIGDKYKKRKTILQLALVSYTLSALVTLTVQPQHEKCVENKGNTTHSKTLEFFQSGVSLGRSLVLSHETNGKANFTTRNYSVQYQREMDQKELDNMFAIILLITLLGQVLGCVVFCFPEALTIALLEDNEHKYGAVRFLGEVSVAISSFAVGAALHGTETEVCGHKFKNYFIAFYFFAAWMATALIATIWMKVKYHDPRPDIALKEVVNSVVNLKSLAVWIVSVFLGSFQGMHESFGLWFLDDLGGSTLLIGVAAGSRYSLATIGFIASQYFIRYFGVLRALIVAKFCYGIVFCGFSIMTSPGTALVFYVLQGFLYSLSWCAVIIHVGHISQDTGYTASIQGIYSGGLGYGGGAILGGVLVQVFGIRITYQSFAAAAVLLCFLLIAVYCLTERRDDKDDVHYELIDEEKHYDDNSS